METLKGTHGTCRSSANRILDEGFRIGHRNRYGNGVYFWGYTDSCMLDDARKLAIGWWKFSNGKQQYRDMDDPKCAVIHVSLAGKLLDLESLENRQRFITFTNTIWKRLSQKYKSDQKILNAAYDLFISTIERQANTTFDIVHVKVPLPGGFVGTLPFEITGHPSCFVVKKIDVITEIHVEEIENE